MRVRLVQAALAAAIVLCGCSGGSDDRSKGPPLEMTRTFDKPSATGALASVWIDFDGGFTKALALEFGLPHLTSVPVEETGSWGFFRHNRHRRL
jgi:hypothetical protein